MTDATLTEGRVFTITADAMAPTSCAGCMLPPKQTPKIFDIFSSRLHHVDPYCADFSMCFVHLAPRWRKSWNKQKKMLSKMLGNPWLFFLLGRWRIIDLIDTDTWFCARICRDVLGTPWFYSVLSTHRTRAYVSQFPLEICESSFFHPKCLVSKLLTSRKFSLLGKSPT